MRESSKVQWSRNKQEGGEEWADEEDDFKVFESGKHICPLIHPIYHVVYRGNERISKQVSPLRGFLHFSGREANKEKRKHAALRSESGLKCGNA